jgi:two-component system, OmpR family, phosphate regulon response regulator PhoB
VAPVIEGITVVGNVQVTSISEPLGDESLIEESDFWEAFDGPPTVAMEVTVQMFLTPDDMGQARLRVVAERLHRLAAAEMSDSGGSARVTTRMTVPVASPDLPLPLHRRELRLPAAGPRLLVLTGPREALLDGIKLELTKMQFDLLMHFLDHAGRVLTRRQLMDRICDRPEGGCPRTIDVHVKRLRAKLAGGGPTITTIRGVGYRLDGHDRALVADVM